MRNRILHMTGGLNRNFPVRKTLFASSILGLALAFTPIANAQDASGDTTATDGFRLNVETPFSNNTEFVDLNTAIDLPPESIGSQIFDLDTNNLGCMTGEAVCLSREQNLNMRYSKSLTASIDSLIDIQLTPRASMSHDDDASSALVGALVRIGDDLKDDAELKSNTWYMFAGADAEAVSYAPNAMRRVSVGDFLLQDRIIVGDAQAGVGYRMGSTDISLGYFRREVTSLGNDLNTESSSYSEDAAALSFTWRR